MDSPRINPETRIGCVHLKANIEPSLGPYRDVLGFEVTQRYGEDAVLLSPVGTITTLVRMPGPAATCRPTPVSPPASSTSLSSPRSAASSPGRSGMLLDVEHPLNGVSDHGVSDHGVSESLYLRDLDDNGLELCRVRPREAWIQDGEGKRVMVTQPFGARGLLAELDGAVRGG